MKESGVSTAFFLQNFKLRDQRPTRHRKTPFEMAIDEKLSPLKQKYNIYSALKSGNPQAVVAENVLITTREMDALDSEYEKIKRSRKEPIPLRRSQYFRDSLHKSLYLQKRKSLKHQSQKQSEWRLPSLSRLVRFNKSQE